jgi:adenylate cyclase
MPPLTEVERNLQAHMIAKQRLAESDLLSSLYRALIENHDLPSGLRAALKSSVNLLARSSVLRGLPLTMKDKIRFCSSWHQDDPKLAEFIGLCQQQSFARDLGIPGRVWHHGKDEWTRDLTVEITEPFALAAAAKAADLKAAFAVPITHHHHFNGVLMFRARDAKDEDERFTQIIPAQQDS